MVPTVLDLCGIPIPNAVQGRSFRPALEGDTTFGRESALTECAGCTSLRTDTHRYVCYQNGRELLFDHTTDPTEYIDVSGDPNHADQLASHRHALCVRQLSTVNPKRREWAY